jgi:hypothetical protein
LFIPFFFFFFLDSHFYIVSHLFIFVIFISFLMLRNCFGSARKWRSTAS